MMELFPKIVNGVKPLTISGKSFIIDVWLGPQYAAVVCPPNFFDLDLLLFERFPPVTHKYLNFQNSDSPLQHKKT